MEKKGKEPERSVEGRRHFLQAIAAAVAAGAMETTMALSSSASLKSRSSRIVIVGGGFSGARVATLLRRVLPDVDIVLLEKNKSYVPGPLVLDFLFSEKNLSQITYHYDGLKRQKINVVHAQVRSVHPDKNEIVTDNGNIPYDILVVASGIRLAFEDIAGIDSPITKNYCIYNCEEVEKVKAGIAEFREGTIVINVPSTTLSCPPAPYEYLLLWAQRIREKKLKAHIVFIDSGSQPQPSPLASRLKKEIERYDDVIEYIWAGGHVAAVDPKTKKVLMDNGDKHRYDFLSLIPGNSAAPFVADLESSIVGDKFVNVNPLTMQSTSRDNIFALGDVARLPYGKSAYAANVCAALCVEAITKKLGIHAQQPDPLVRVACFPYASSTTAFSMSVQYQVDIGSEGIKLHSQAQVSDGGEANLAQRRNWVDTALRETFQN